MNHQPAQRPNRVTAIFEHARIAFDMARGVTLAQLAEQRRRWVRSMAACRCRSMSKCRSIERTKDF